jgi:hypothetical protein
MTFQGTAAIGIGFAPLTGGVSLALLGPSIGAAVLVPLILIKLYSNSKRLI